MGEGYKCNSLGYLEVETKLESCCELTNSMRANVNVMLGENTQTNEGLLGREFPCPICGMALKLRLSRREKPYCICDPCGIQLFIRGKLGITRLQELVESGSLVSGRISKASLSVTLYNRLEQLKAQKAEMQSKQGLIFQDRNLENAIFIVEKEIEGIESRIEKLAKQRGRGKK